MPRSIEKLLRDLNVLRHKDDRSTALERELAVAIDLLRNSEERLRLAVEAAHIGIWEWDIGSDRVTWDAKKHDVFGLAHGSFAGTTEAFFELVHPADRAGLRIAISEALDHGAPYQNQFRIVGPLGGTRWIANLGQVYRDDEGRPLRMIGVVYDVTERHATERALRESEEKFRSLVETTNEWIWALDSEGRVTYSNSRVETILGYRPEELMGHTLLSLVHEADRQRVEETLSQGIASKRGWPAIVVRCRRKDHTFRYLECQGVPILDDAGHVIGFRGSNRDVTDRVEAEQELREARKMDGIGRLVVGFAHHFDNLLTVIVGHVETALDESGGEAIDARLQAVRDAAQRGTLLTRRILAFAGKELIKPTVVDLNDHIDTLSIALRRVVGERITLVTHLARGLWAVKADPSQLEAVFMNLAVNALESMPDGGTLTIATANVTTDDENALHEAEVVPGEYVMVAFRDTGRGMTGEVSQQIFQPFFSTKESGPDSVGLGLSICYGIVAQHGGHIRVQTQPQVGSTFRIYLPRVPAASEILDAARSRSVRESVATHERRVAIVDDHEAMRTAILRLVEAAGISAVAFPSAEAFLVSHSVGSIDCLILDVQMPGMNGLQLQRHLVDRGLHVPIVFVTADDHPAIRARALAGGAIRVLRKARLGVDLRDALEAAFRVQGRGEN